MLAMRFLIDQAKDEAKGVMDYAKSAMDFKGTRPDLSQMYIKMAQAESEHFTNLHNWIIKLKSEAESKGESIPPGMLERYELLHKELMDEYAQAKALLELAK